MPNAKPIDENRKEFINFIKSDHQGAMKFFFEAFMPEPNIEYMKRLGVHICLRPNLEVAVRVLELTAKGEKDYPLNGI